tara:strand:+ start:946 stop:2187 length:1242 start_codon:yes stop_codon:yes gene_type:complete
MIKEIRLPDLGEGIDSAVVSEIPVASGNQISKDEVLLVLESDKASMEIPSDHNGKITEVLIKEGDDVSTNDLLFKIETSETGSVSKSEESQVIREPEPEPEPEPIPMLKPEGSKLGDGVFASPGVRRLARELEVNLGLIRGTGAKGRTTKNDLHGYIKMRMQDGSGSRKSHRESIDFSQWGNVEFLKLTKVNKITGQRLQESWQDIPHVTQHNYADITELDGYRKKIKEEAKKEGKKVTFLPFLMRAVALVLKEMPRFNSSLDEKEESLVIKNYYHMGVAVDTPSGLMVPCVRDVDKKTILELSEELMDISQRAREKKLKPNELKGSSFTISSLGGIGGTSFSPIVNPPEVAILGVSKSEWKPVYNKESGGFEPRYQLPFSLSYDHRVIDGASGASFVERLSTVLGEIDSFKD